MARGFYNIEVSLHNDSIDSFYTGDIVTGIINLDLEKDLKVEAIEMEILGLSKALWSRFIPVVPYIKIYSEKKKILSLKQNDLFMENIRVDKKMSAGIYCFPFHFALPHDLPSTFKSSIASVNYYIKIKSKSGKIRKFEPFNVISNVNLNHLDDMMQPYEFTYQHDIGSSTKVFLNVITYKSFAPRQILPFKVTIDNEKRFKIKKLRVVLVQKLRYSVPSGYADDQKNICFVDYKKCENTIFDICNFDMEIPQIVPSSINTMEPMIDISYELRVELYFSFHFNFTESIPVTIAAVPVIYN